MKMNDDSKRYKRDEFNVFQALQSLANEPVEPEHFAQMMAKVRIKAKRMDPMRKLVRSSLWAGGLGATIVTAMILIPATYSVQVGSLVSVEFTVPEGRSVNEIVKVIPTFTKGRKTVMVDDGKATLTLASQEFDAEEIGAKLRSDLAANFPEITDLKVNTEPILEHRGGNALAAATGGRIEIGCEGMTDNEIEAAIAQALTSHGLKVQQVSVSTTEPAEGHIERRVEIRAEAEDGAELPELELEVGEGDRENQQERVIVRERK